MRYGAKMTTFNQLIHRVTSGKNKEAGETLPGLLVTSLVGSFVLIAVGAFLYSALSSNNSIAEQTALSATTTVLDTSLRNDITNATVITPLTPTSVKFTIPGNNGGCKENTWNIAVVGTKTIINKTVASYSGQVLGANGVVTCSSATTTISSVVASNITAGTNFTFANYVGHEVTVTSGGVLALSSATAPTGTPAAAWGKKNVSRVSIDTTVNGIDTETRPFKLSQYSTLANSSGKTFP